MNLYCNHTLYDDLMILKTYRFDDNQIASKPYRTHGRPSGLKEALIPELLSRYNPWYLTLGIYILGLFSLFSAIYTNGQYRSELEKNIFKIYFFEPLAFIVFYICVILSICLLIKYFADLRNFYFCDDKVIFQSRRCGRRIYDSKDLKFHLIQVDKGLSHYYLDVEIPDVTIPENRRLIVLEIAASLKTMYAILATLLPLIQGDPTNYNQSIPREYDHEPYGVKPNLGLRFWNFLTHALIKYLDYEFNKVLFWLIHGNYEKLLKKHHEYHQ